MPSADCSLWMLAARTDIPFMMQTIPHLVKMCNFPFAERVLAIDAGQLAGEYTRRPGIGSLEQLRDCCQKLIDQGVIDRTVDIDFSAAYRDRIYRKHFSIPVKETHNYRGAPVLGYIFCVEEPKSDYVLYFDCDMLLYQKPGYNWIEAGIELMQRRSDVVLTLPLAGPPNQQGIAAHQGIYKDMDSSDGFFAMKRFTSRKFLIDRQRFNQLLPLKVKWEPKRRRPKWMPSRLHQVIPESWQAAVSNLTGVGGLERWENLVTNSLQASSLVRADLDGPAWTIHPHSHGPEFIQALPKIIERVEQGWYPPEQIGVYDLHMKSWLPALV